MRVRTLDQDLKNQICVTEMLSTEWKTTSKDTIEMSLPQETIDNPFERKFQFMKRTSEDVRDALRDKDTYENEFDHLNWENAWLRNQI